MTRSSVPLIDDLIAALGLPDEFRYIEADMAFWQAVEKLPVDMATANGALHVWGYLTDHIQPSDFREPTPAEMAAFAECARRIITNSRV